MGHMHRVMVWGQGVSDTWRWVNTVQVLAWFREGGRCRGDREPTGTCTRFQPHGVFLRCCNQLTWGVGTEFEADT